MDENYKPIDKIVERDFTAVKPSDELSVIGYGSLLDRDGEQWNYTKYRDPEDGFVYFVGEDGKIMLRDEGDDHQVIDPNDDEGRNIVLRIHELKTRDEAIQMARIARAKELSHGDKVLEWILLQSREILNENPQPYKRRGIDLYSVGENASHSFYLGVKDGRIYRYSLSDDLCIKDELCYVVEDDYSTAVNMTTSELKERLTEEAKEIALTKIVGRIIEKVVDKTMVLLKDADEDEKQKFQKWVNYYFTDEELKKYYRIYCDRKNSQEITYQALLLLTERAKELWRSELEKYIEQALNTSENTPFVYSPKGTNFEIHQELVHDPVDVTDEESVYISRGTFVKPSELEVPQQVLKEDLN